MVLVVGAELSAFEIDDRIFVGMKLAGRYGGE